MQKSLLLIFSLFLVGQLFAQERTYSTQKMKFGQDAGTVLLIPFEQKMLLSDINKEIGSRTGMTLDEIRTLFREGLCQVISNEFAGAFDVIDLVNGDVSGAEDDIQRAHHSIGYTYNKIPPKADPEASKARKLFDQVVNKDKPDQQGRGVFVDEGEILTYYDEKARYMHTQVLTEDVFNYLSGRHTFDYVLFINELDIQVQRIHSSERGQIWDRVVKIHFTMFDKSGKDIVGGAAFSTYDGTQKDIFKIIGTSFQPAIEDMKVQLTLALEMEPEKKQTPFPFSRKRDKQEDVGAIDTGF